MYDQNGGAGSEVDGPVGTIEDATIEEITETSYGPLKALCEQAAEHEFGDRTLVVRPGLIVGPYDPTDRFTYWPARIAEGGTVLAPGDPGARTQVIDVRDLAGMDGGDGRARRQRALQRGRSGAAAHDRRPARPLQRGLRGRR